MAIKFLVGRVVFETVTAAEIFNQRVLGALNADEGDVTEKEFADMADHLAASTPAGTGSLDERVRTHRERQLRADSIPAKPRHR